MKMTPWFSPDVSPAYVGFYKTKCNEGEEWFNYFDGTRWHYGNRHLKWASKDDKPLPSKYMCGWRGLAEQPK